MHNIYWIKHKGAVDKFNYKLCNVIYSARSIDIYNYTWCTINKINTIKSIIKSGISNVISIIIKKYYITNCFLYYAVVDLENSDIFISLGCLWFKSSCSSLISCLSIMYHWWYIDISRKYLNIVFIKLIKS